MTIQLADSTPTGNGRYQEPVRDHAGWTGSEALQPLVEFVRQGQDTSLKSVQLWAEIARLCNPIEQPDPAVSALVDSSYDLFETLLAAQRQFVDQLLKAQRQFAEQLFAVDDQRTG